MILIAGPYRSGTGDDPLKLAANVRRMEGYALPLFRAGHLPVVGEWLALPLVELAGSCKVGDAAFDLVFHPVAERLLERCEAVLRIGGSSAGADLMVAIARERGLAVFDRLAQVPGCEGAPEPADAGRGAVPTAEALETDRLRIRRLTLGDAPFIVQLLNDAAFVRYIGDKGVRSEADACRYLREGPMASHERFGFGLDRVELKETGEPIGICGLLQRDTLPQPDVGFAFLAEHRGRGLAREAVAAVLERARAAQGIDTVLAITSLDNERSIALLQGLGFRLERRSRLTDGAAEVNVLVRSAAAV